LLSAFFILFFKIPPLFLGEIVVSKVFLPSYLLSTGSETKPALLYFSLINRPASLVSLFPQYYSSNSLTLAAVSNLRASNSA